MLLTGNQDRGADATGIAFSQADGSIQVFKKDVPAWNLVTIDAYFKFIEEYLKPDTWAAILHTRGASQGTPRDNNNNHPMFAGVSAAIHNGQIYNEDSVFGRYRLKKCAETDSDIFRAIADEYGLTPKAVEVANELQGSAASAILHPKYPKKMLLLRSGSPMTLGSTEDFFFFSSTKDTLHNAMRPWVERFGMWFQVQKPNMAFAPMADHTAWIIGEKGQEYHGEFKILRGQYHEPFRRTYSEYEARQKKWNGKEETEPAWCYVCKKSWTIPKGEKPYQWHCPKEKKGCGNTLSWMPNDTKVAAK